MTRESSVEDTKVVKEAVYKDEIEVDEVVSKFINSSKYYNIDFLIGVITSHE